MNKIEELRKKMGKLDADTRSNESNKDELHTQVAKQYFKDMTLDDLKSLWNISRAEKRYEILEATPYYLPHLNKLDSHGGLRAGEIEYQIIKSKFDECEWLTNDLFTDFLKESED